MSLPVALAIAVLLHLVLVVGTQVMPGFRAALLPDLPARPPDPDPLRFTFVDLPQERPEPERPPENARPSDRTRRARSEPPAEALPPSPDPFSQGNTDQRVDAQPAPQPAPTRQQPIEAADASSQRKDPAPSVQPSSVAPEEMFPAPREDPDDEPARQPSENRLEGLEEALRPFSSQDLGQRFDNPGAPSLTDFGPISFDTVGVDWGPYARIIVEIIRARWMERMPPAARMGLSGRSIISFRIALDGDVSTIVLVDGSGYRPLDKAAEFAIEAADLPPLPPAFVDLGKDDVGVTFEFYYNMRVPKR